MMRHLPILFFFAWSTAFAAPEFRQFTDTAGQTTMARIISVDGNEVTIQVEGSARHYDLPMSRFSEADRKYIEKWTNDISVLATPSDRFEVYVGAKRSQDESGLVTWRYKHEQIVPTIKFTNQEYQKDFKKITGVIAIMGVDFTNSGNFGVLDVQTFELGDIPRDSVKEWEGSMVKTTWLDDDDAYDDSYGWRYKGYSITLLNHKGDEIYRRATRKLWERDYQTLKRLKTGQSYDSSFEHPTGVMVMPQN